MKLATKVTRLFVAAAIGVGIALLEYFFLLQWMHWAYEGRLQRWMLVVASAVLYGLLYYGVVFLIKKATP